MKKISIYSLATILAVFMLISCNGKKYEAAKADLKNQNDSLNYALGLSNGSGMKDYYMTSVQDENKAIKAFIDALDKAYNEKSDPDEMYLLGLQLGSSFKKQEKTGLFEEPDVKFNYNLVRQGLVNGLNGANEGMSPYEAQSYIESFMMKKEAEKMNSQQQGQNPYGDPDITVQEEIVDEEVVK